MPTIWLYGNITFTEKVCHMPKNIAEISRGQECRPENTRVLSCKKMPMDQKNNIHLYFQARKEQLRKINSTIYNVNAANGVHFNTKHIFGQGQKRCLIVMGWALQLTLNNFDYILNCFFISFEQYYNFF